MAYTNQACYRQHQLLIEAKEAFNVFKLALTFAALLACNQCCIYCESSRLACGAE